MDGLAGMGMRLSPFSLQAHTGAHYARARRMSTSRVLINPRGLFSAVSVPKDDASESCVFSFLVQLPALPYEPRQLTTGMCHEK